MYNLLMVCSLASPCFVPPDSAEGMIFLWFCAQANAQDTSLEALITAGRADIATGQATVESLLNKIIGEQNTAAAAEAAAASALAAIESLTTQQQAAAANIATAYSSSLNSIEVSTVSRNSASSVFSSALATLVFVLSGNNSQCLHGSYWSYNCLSGQHAHCWMVLASSMVRPVLICSRQEQASFTDCLAA